jgi:hypothetical protein
MTPFQARRDAGYPVRSLAAAVLVVIAGAIVAVPPATAEASRPLDQVYPITIDATALVSQSWWQVPGVTPSIWTSDPETSDAYRTTETRQLALQPGPYKFVSFTFDFPFTVTQDGTLDFSASLDECVEGRGTHTLVVKCKRTYPYGGRPEY